MAVELAVGLMLALLVLVPHLLPLERVAPASAATVWLLTLGLRATIAVGAAVFVFLYLPSAGLVHVATHWCFHTLLPLLADQLGMRGHSIADLASLLPALTLTASVLWVTGGLLRAALALRRLLHARIQARGPLGATIVDEDRVFVALTGLGRGRIVVSRAALEALDGAELAASVAHERGHLRRRHRPVLILARVLAALARPVPGTRAAEAELAFSLERDADEYAVRTTRDPLALASAICKSAGAAAPPRAVVGLRGRGGLVLRLEYLMDGGRQRAAAGLERTTRALAAVLAATLLLVAVAAPTVALGAAAPEPSPELVGDCAS
jgi:Zn-dependent protease with chaperone function